MEPLARARTIQQGGGGSEPGRETTVEVLEPRNDPIRSHGIDITERPATEGGKAKSKDGADIAVARRAENLFVETHRRLVYHREHAPFLDLRRRDLAPVIPADHLVDGRIHRAFVAFFVVQIESAL